MLAFADRAQPRQPVGSRSGLGSEILQALGHDANQCAKRPSALCPVAGSPSQVCLNPSICDRLAVSPPSQRACVPHTLHAYVHKFPRAFSRSNTPGQTPGPNRASELDRETVKQWVLWPSLWESVWWVCSGEDACAAPTHQHTSSWTKNSGAIYLEPVPSCCMGWAIRGLCFGTGHD